MCASPLSEVRFNYTGGDCSTSNNAQGDDTCVDSNGGPPAGDVAITCFDDQMVLAQQTVAPGESIAVTGMPLLPEILTCVVTSVNEDTTYQEVQFNTRSDFTAKARFGSLEVEQCGDLECIIDVTYTYTASNVGEAPINITSMTRTRDGETVDLTDMVDPTELDVGESTVVQEPDEVDYCVSSVITTTVDISSFGEECAVNLTRRGLLRHLFEEYVVSVARYELNVQVQ